MGNWAQVFFEGSDPLEMIVRGTVMYWVIFVMLRMAGRRDIGSVGVADLVVVMLIADAAGSAMAPEDDATLLSGIVVVGTIVFWSVVINRLDYHFPSLRRFFDPGRVLLVRDGVIQREGMRRECFTDDELYAEIRQAGVEKLEQVHLAYIEGDGRVSVIRREDAA